MSQNADTEKGRFRPFFMRLLSGKSHVSSYQKHPIFLAAFSGEFFWEATISVYFSTLISP